MNYYKNHIIYNIKNNNILDINTINYTKKIILIEQIIIVLRSTLLIRLK